MAHFDTSFPENPAEQILQDRVCNLEIFVTQVQGDNHRLVEQVRLLVKLQDSPSIITLPKIPLPLTYTSPPLLHLMGLLQPYQISKLNFTIFLVAVLACMIQHLNNSSTLEI